MTIYNAKIATNDAIELILFSADRSDKGALNWAKKEDFPWPTLTPSIVKKYNNELKGISKHFNSYVPQYLLFDADKKLIKTDKLSNLLKKIGI